MSEHRRVVLVGPVAPFRGGIAQHTARLAEQFAVNGDPVVVESWARQYPRFLYKRAEHEEGAGPFPGARFTLRWFDPISWVRVAARNRRPDHLVLQWVTPFPVLILAGLRIVMRPVRTTVFVHNAIPHERFPLVRPLTRLGFFGVDKILCHADAVREDLASLGVDTRSATSVPMPPLIRLEPTPLPPAPPIKLLFLGYIRPYKGADIGVDALAAIRKSHPHLDLTLTIAGESWSQGTSLADQAAELGIEREVTIVDRYISDQEMTELIETHHIVVAPYRSATQSGVVSLALAGGRPTVATNVGGLAEAIVHNVTGIVCEPNSVSAFADAVVLAVSRLEPLAEGALRQGSGWLTVTEAITARP